MKSSFHVLALAALVAACANDGGSTTEAGACVPCVSDNDCNGAVCAQLGGDSYCAAPCPNGNECTSDQQCMTVSSITGDALSVCVQTASTTCGPNTTDDAGAPPTSCPGLADPSTTATCTSCTQYNQPCQANGCYGGWWCNTQTNKCQQPPATCGSGDGGTPGPFFDGGVTGNIDGNGGTESLLYFAIVGDTRPATEDDTAHYPSAVIGKIFSDLGALQPVPPFVVSTGDYQFSNPYGNQAQAQLQLYIDARGSYPGIQFPTMGNHECTGGTASNCGKGNQYGLTNNYDAFMSMLLGPLQKTLPYYEIDVAEPNNAWTAKFVFVAANAWDATQASWLDSALAKSTTYTFVVRHEPAAATTAPGVTPSQTIMAKHPYTLAIVGHTHEYHHTSGSREVIIGNGGAPLATTGNYGYGIVLQRSDGSLQVDMYDYQSGAPDTKFRFAVHPDGSHAP